MWPVFTRFYAEAAQWPRTLLDSFCCAIIIIIIIIKNVKIRVTLS